MSSRAKTPSPPKGTTTVPTHDPMAPPATPGASTTPEPVPGTPRTPGTTVARTPGGTLVLCVSDPAAFLKQKARTATCTICDKKNGTDHMRKCPGCAWQICLRCQEKRKAAGEDLKHGDSTPSLSLLSSGPSKRRTLLPIAASSPLKRATSAPRAMDMTTASPTIEMLIATKGKGKGKEKAAPTAKAAGKKRAAKSKPKSTKPMDADSSSADDAFSEPDSPIRKKARTSDATAPSARAFQPTATSNRPHRTTTTTTTTTTLPTAPAPNYAPRSSPDTDPEPNVHTSVGRRLGHMSPAELALAFTPRPASRIQELLEQAGVDTPGNRYESYLLSTHQPALSSHVPVIPATVRRMAEKRMSAEGKVERRNAGAINPALNNSQHTVRAVAAGFASSVQEEHPSLSPNEHDELFAAVKEKASAWVARMYKQLPAALQATVSRGLDMRLDHVDSAWRGKLLEVLDKVATKKVGELEERGREEEGDGMA